jgi:hypothetical protein
MLPAISNMGFIYFIVSSLEDKIEVEIMKPKEDQIKRF